MKDTFNEAFEAESKEGKESVVVETKTTDEVVDGQGSDENDAQAQADKDKNSQEGKDKPSYEDIEQKYKSLQGMIKSQQEEKDEALRKAQELEDKLAEAMKEKELKPKPDALDLDAELEEYIKDYAFISTNEAKLRQKELNKLKQDIIDEVAKNFKVSQESVEKLLKEDSETKAAIHLSTILDAHPDYGKSFARKDIVGWVETLSPAKKKANLAIINEGDADEVIDLINVYKEVNNIPILDVDAPSKKIVTDKKNDERLENLEVVKSKKAPVTGGGKGKAETFAEAFNEAASVK